jgi:hypothetical protein
MEEADRTAALKRLEPLLGAWNIETGIPGGEGVVGRMEVEWLLGGAFLVQRSEVPHPAAPDGFCVIAPKDGDASGAYVQHYFDSRGVVRIYSMTLRDGVWTLLRDSADFTPLSFAQRFVGTFSEDENVITGAWETSQDASTWEKDFDLTYTRAR